MTDTLSAVQAWATQVDDALSSLPTSLEQAAPSGDFAAVLSEVQSMLAAGPEAAADGSAEGSSGAAGSTGAGALGTGTSASAAGGSLGTGSSSNLGEEAVQVAEQYLGVPYVWGGESPSGFDCSGLVQYVYAQLGISLPRTSEEQATAGVAVPSLADAQPGDLVFFAGSDGTDSSPGHVGIYIGNGEMIDAPYTGASVQIEPVGDPVAIRRVVPTDGGDTGASALGSAAAASADSSDSSGSSGGGIQVPSSLAPLFVSAAGQYGVPVTLLTAVAQQESGFDTNAVSSAGAEGLMQLMPGTAAGLGVDPFDPAQAIDGAAQLLSGYLQQFGSVPLALAAYNAGPGAVEEYGGIPPYAQTQQYVASIMSELGGSA